MPRTPHDASSPEESNAPQVSFEEALEEVLREDADIIEALRET